MWSFVIRYAMVQLNFDGVLASLGNDPSVGVIIDTLRHVEPVAGAFYNGCEWLGLNDLLHVRPSKLQQLTILCRLCFLFSCVFCVQG